MGPEDRYDGAPDLLEIVEAVLYAADEPVEPERLAEVLGQVAGPESEGATGSGQPASIDAPAIRATCLRLQERYDRVGSAIRIVEVAGGFRLGTRPTFDPYIRALRQVERPSRLSVPVLETLAVIAYRQPVTLAEIGAVRGKDPASTLRRLRELGLVRIAGRKRTVGRPFTYGTTARFLEIFGLRDLDELPAPEEFQELLEG